MEKVIRRNNGRSVLFVGLGLWVIYAILTWTAPNTTSARYGLTEMQLNLVQLTVILPLLFIWSTAIMGAMKFKRYASLIEKNRDGQALNLVTNGLLILVLSLILQTILSLPPRFFHSGTVANSLVFLHNHLPALLSLVAFIIIFLGSSRLARLVRIDNSNVQKAIVAVPGLALSGIVGWYFYTHVTHGLVNGVPNFSLPGKLPFYTIGIPYILSWFFGLLSIINIVSYATHVKGAIYRQALRLLALGLMFVLAFAIFLQLLTLVATALSAWKLGPILGLLYFLLIFYAVGFVLIIKGANKLTRIEDAQ